MLEVEDANTIADFEIALVVATQFGNNSSYLMRWYEADWRWSLELALQCLQV
jgi:hypothetical protein